MANAWIDSDGNGQQDAGEPPLAGVEFALRSGDHGVSDAAGQYTLHAMSGCSAVPTFSVSALPPAGYALTTPGVVELKGDGKVAFGFAAK
ncbi:MAG: hypothetical protein U0232_19465 [Thermomicrobiales bacterium]